MTIEYIARIQGHNKIMIACFILFCSLYITCCEFVSNDHLIIQFGDVEVTFKQYGSKDFIKGGSGDPYSDVYVDTLNEIAIWISNGGYLNFQDWLERRDFTTRGQTRMLESVPWDLYIPVSIQVDERNGYVKSIYASSEKERGLESSVCWLRISTFIATENYSVLIVHRQQIDCLPASKIIDIANGLDKSMVIRSQNRL